MSSEHARRSADLVGCLPLGFFCDFLELLRSHPAIEVITYDDLAWGEDFDYQHDYPVEERNWKQWLRTGRLDRQKIRVLLQHDVDGDTEHTMEVLREEERLGLRSNVMIFRRRLDRRLLARQGELRFTEYDVDVEYLQHLEREKGFVVGYHSNAFEQALFDLDKAARIFEEDVRLLREHFDILYFSPHGGVPGPDGRNNPSLALPATLQRSLRWVQNGHSPFFTRQYSDGGLNSRFSGSFWKLRDLQRLHRLRPARRDLRRFVRSWRRGGRYRVLTHPQYLGVTCHPAPALEHCSWYRQVLEAYSHPEGSAWHNVPKR